MFTAESDRHLDGLIPEVYLCCMHFLLLSASSGHSRENLEPQTPQSIAHKKHYDLCMVVSLHHYVTV